MIKESITYTDFDGNEVTEDFYFHMSQIELNEFMIAFPNGIKEYLKEVLKNSDAQKMLDLAKDLVFRSYGERTANGKGFIKSKEKSEEFTYTPAYDTMVMKLITDEGKMEAFMRGVIPKNLANELDNPEVLKETEALKKELLEVTEN